MGKYRCPTCMTGNKDAYVVCNHPACPDGRDQPSKFWSPEASPLVTGVEDPTSPAIFAIVIAVVALALALCSFAAHADDGYWTRMAGKHNCAWVSEMRKRYTDEELARKAARWHVPQRLIELGKSCPR